MTFLLYVPQNDKNSMESLMLLHHCGTQKKSLKEKMEEKEGNCGNAFYQNCTFWYF